MDEPESSSFIGAEEEAMHMEKVVAWNVKMLLTARRASQLALAEALGIKKAAMSRKINGYISWSLADVVKAARFLGTTPEDLMDDTLMKKMTDAPDHAHQGALVGAGSPRFLVSPFNPDAPIEGGISGAAKGALAGFIPPVVPSGTDSPSTPSKHDGIGVSGRSQAHETLGTMTTVIMRTTLGEGVPVVRSDHEQGGRLIARQLIDSGARHVVLVGGPRSQFAEGTTFPTIRYHLTVERLLAEAGIACDYVEAGAVADIAAHEATACAIFEQYPDVDAIVGSDVVASVALQEASRRGIEVPADLQVIAYDGTLMAETAGKRLTAIRQDFPAIAAALAVRMDSQIAADGGPASPSKNDSASDVDTQPTPEEVIPVALIPGETTR